MAWMMRQTAPFQGDTKLGGVGDTFGECAAIQRDSDWRNESTESLRSSRRGNIKSCTWGKERRYLRMD